MKEERIEKIKAYKNIMKTCIEPIKELINFNDEEQVRDYSILCMEIIAELVRK